MDKNTSGTPKRTWCYSLAGAVYGVWKNSSCTGEPFKRMTTDTKGHAKVDKLPFGNYWVKEITPSKGFELDTKIYPISITETKPKATIRSVEPNLNDPAGIEITKIWNGPETPTIPPLAGTQFTICYYDGYFTKDNLPDYDSYNSTAKRKWVLEIQWNEDNQKYQAGLTEKYLVKLQRFGMDQKHQRFHRLPEHSLRFVTMTVILQKIICQIMIHIILQQNVNGC